MGEGLEDKDDILKRRGVERKAEGRGAERKGEVCRGWERGRGKGGRTNTVSILR